MKIVIIIIISEWASSSGSGRSRRNGQPCDKCIICHQHSAMELTVMDIFENIVRFQAIDIEQKGFT